MLGSLASGFGDIERLVAATDADMTQLLFRALPLFGLLLAIIGVATWLIMRLRKRLKEEPNLDCPQFSLDQLRQLRNKGELTIEQYECLRVTAIREARGEPR